MRYIDDTLLVCPRRTKIDELLKNMNNINKNIQFTKEEEDNNTLPFLDVEIIRAEREFKFKVYRKPTYKNDILHFYSHHDASIKIGVIIGFYLRAIRICSEEHLKEEFNIIKQNFNELKYPASFIEKARKKAQKIMKNNGNIKKEEKRRIILNTNETTQDLKRKINNELQIIPKTSTTINDILRKKTKITENRTGSIYKVPCKDCNKQYIGETNRMLTKRIREHSIALRDDDPLNAIALHRTEHNHRIDIENSAEIYKEDNKSRRRLLEAAAISTYNTFKQRPGYYNLSRTLCKKLLQIHNIQPPPHDNRQI